MITIYETRSCCYCHYNGRWCHAPTLAALLDGLRERYGLALRKVGNGTK